MKEQSKIPTSKVQRAVSLVSTGAKIGGNYLKHYAKKTFNSELTKDELHTDNAEDIYNSLSKLKGSALKVAQMLSMDKAFLPKQYSDKFTMAQYQAPPLSGPLVVKTFTKHFGKTPQEIFDTFNIAAKNAASMGQVHEATKNGKKLAVKIQYPGVGDSIQSDLKMVKPIALRMFGMNEMELDRYFIEVEDKLLEETDYDLELKRSVEISEQCEHIANINFPKYYKEYSSLKIITMDWLGGKHLNEFLATNPSQEVRNRIGQALWDFFDYQVHTLKAVHADPHPGNFLMTEEGIVNVIDFGCVKEIPKDFYLDFFALTIPEIRYDKEVMVNVMKKLEMLYDTDSSVEQEFYYTIFIELNRLIARPFEYEEFDFGDDAYMASIYAKGEELSKNDQLRKSKEARGSHHSLYINRTFFGMYSILNQLKANIKTGTGPWKEVIIEHHLGSKLTV